MTSTTFFFVFIPILAIILLVINLIFAPHNPYQEKESTFECGFHSFLGQNRTQFAISFFIFALLFLLFDLEILLVYPYVVSAYANDIYGLVVMLIFFLALTLGFVFEFGKGALKIDSRQMLTIIYRNSSSTLSYQSGFKLIFSSLFKYFTLKRILVGLISLTLIALLRFAFYGGFFSNPLNLVEVFTIGVPAIFIKLGVQGFVDWVFEDLGIKSLLLDIFNRLWSRANTLKIGDNNNSSFYNDSNKKAWKDLYFSKGSNDGELEDKQDKEEVADVSDVPSLCESREPSRSRSPSPMRLESFEGESISIYKATEMEMLHRLKIERLEIIINQYKDKVKLYNLALSALDKLPLERTPEDIESISESSRFMHKDDEAEVKPYEEHELKSILHNEVLRTIDLKGRAYSIANDAIIKQEFYASQLKSSYDKLKTVIGEGSTTLAQASSSTALPPISSEPLGSWSQLKLSYAKFAQEARLAEAKLAEAKLAKDSTSSVEASSSKAEASSSNVEASTDDKYEGKRNAKRKAEDLSTDDKDEGKRNVKRKT